MPGTACGAGACGRGLEDAIGAPELPDRLGDLREDDIDCSKKSSSSKKRELRWVDGLRRERKGAGEVRGGRKKAGRGWKSTDRAFIDLYIDLSLSYKYEYGHLLHYIFFHKISAINVHS
jgi:hypothetical protein